VPGQLRVLDSKTGKELFTVDPKDKGRCVFDATFSPDGKRIVALRMNEVLIWDADTGKEMLRIPVEDVRSLDISPDGQWIVGGSIGSGGSIKVWDSMTGEILQTLNTGKTACVSFSPDSKRIVGHDDLRRGDDGRRAAFLCIWDTGSGKELLSFKELVVNPRCVSFSPNGKFICAGSYNGRITIWNANTGVVERSLQEFDNTHHVNSVSFSPDGKRLVSDGAGAGGLIKVWDISDVK